MEPVVEYVTLVDDEGSPTGIRPKSEVHSTDTPLHLAFSCYLIDDAGRLLVTRRALSKRAWPGVWTNSFCGHPMPEEALPEAVHRRAQEELGTTVRSLQLVLPAFRYRAVDAAGVMENEICPVFVARAAGPLHPASAEVCEWEWVEPEAFAAAVARAPFAFSPWMREQLPLLSETLRRRAAAPGAVTP